MHLDVPQKLCPSDVFPAPSKGSKEQGHEIKSKP